VLLLAGGISGFTIVLIGSRYVNAGEDVIEPMAIFAGVAIYGVAANLCYTLGWITELLWSKC
jgi:hypothetical protein